MKERAALRLELSSVLSVVHGFVPELIDLVLDYAQSNAQKKTLFFVLFVALWALTFSVFVVVVLCCVLLCCVVLCSSQSCDCVHPFFWCEFVSERR